MMFVHTQISNLFFLILCSWLFWSDSALGAIFMAAQDGKQSKQIYPKTTRTDDNSTDGVTPFSTFCSNYDIILLPYCFIIVVSLSFALYLSVVNFSISSSSLSSLSIIIIILVIIILYNIYSYINSF